MNAMPAAKKTAKQKPEETKPKTVKSAKVQKEKVELISNKKTARSNPKTNDKAVAESKKSNSKLQTSAPASSGSSQLLADASRAPMPMPVKPQHLPAKEHAPLIKTSYNKTKLRWFIAASLGVAIVVGGVTAWIARDSLNLPWGNRTNDEQFYNLNLNHLQATPTPSQAELDKINQSLQQSSMTANLDLEQSSSSAALSDQLHALSATELLQILNQHTNELQRQGVDTINLKAYQTQSQSLLDQGQSEQAHTLLIEALTHAQELRIIHSYHN